jgi:hypothetical protein
MLTPIYPPRRPGRLANDLHLDDWRNALRSTGPTTEEGKWQSRRNALRHGLTAETLIDGLEDTEDYRAFDAAVAADYEARTADRTRALAAVGLAALAATADHFDRDRSPEDAVGHRPRTSSRVSRFGHAIAAFCLSSAAGRPGGRRRRDITLRLAHVGPRLDLLLLRLSNVDNGAFERLGRYNAAWKQTAQTLFLLHSIRRA